MQLSCNRRYPSHLLCLLVCIGAVRNLWLTKRNSNCLVPAADESSLEEYTRLFFKDLPLSSWIKGLLHLLQSLWWRQFWLYVDEQQVHCFHDSFCFTSWNVCWEMLLHFVLLSRTLSNLYFLSPSPHHLQVWQGIILYIVQYYLEAS